MEQLGQWLQKIARIWTFELFSLDGHPLTVGMLFVGVILLIVGYRFARRAADEIDRRFLAHLDLDPSVRYMLGRGIYYLFLVIVLLFTLRVMHVPITAFTFVGGALAIGFGFGSQNIVNNFISGLIMMVERPVRVGDFIEVDGLRGTVELIGIRATHLKTPDNREVILPNSFFLEKAVTNWTLSDDIVRSEFTIGVAYGTPTHKFKEILLKVCDTSIWILKSPAPKVLFADFGDNALIFKLQFWWRQRGELPGAEIESDLRFRVDEELRRAAIAVPFPQRDLHVEFPSPIKVQLAPESRPSS